MKRPPRNVFFRSEQIFQKPRSAIEVLGDAFDVTHEEAREALQKLVSAGYFIAPREPLNHMFDAYLGAYGQKAKTVGSIIVGIAKARKRWHAMGAAGTRYALSWQAVSKGVVNETPGSTDE